MSLVRQQLASKQRQIRLFDLTLTELHALPAVTPVYEGIGKMFLMGERGEVVQRISEEKKGTEGDAVAMNKKLEYLEKTFENAKLHIQAAMGQQSTVS